MPLAIAGDVHLMLAVGIIWGTTNALMKKGALIWDKHTPKSKPQSSLTGHVIAAVKTIISLVLTWQYSVPVVLNLAASAAFFGVLGKVPISVAVPVTNGVTFVATAGVGMGLGEECGRVGEVLGGVAMIVVGVWLCVS
ncbi:hypothetical protein Droror1_Dr00001192 [Drosera rotundifolia]